MHTYILLLLLQLQLEDTVYDGQLAELSNHSYLLMIGVQFITASGMPGC